MEEHAWNALAFTLGAAVGALARRLRLVEEVVEEVRKVRNPPRSDKPTTYGYINGQWKVL